MTLFSDTDLERIMLKCIGLGTKAKTNPELRPPYVGAVIVDWKGQIISSGYRKLIPGVRNLSPDQFSVHAEHEALDQAVYPLEKGSVLVTTLEPCVPRKKATRRSCSELIIQSGIKTVIFGLYDDSPSVPKGAGIEYLNRHGIKTIHYEELSDKIIELMPGKYIKQHLNK